jgi:TolA-binding protein
MKLRLRLRFVALGIAPLLCSGALAHADSVDDASARVGELESKLNDLDQRLKPPEDPKGELAERRLVDAEVAYELKNYEVASTLLYDLVEKYPNSRVFPEALYYLADSLYLKRDFFSSRRYFEKLVEIGTSSGKYQEALQRLIELSMHTGDYDPVDGYLAKLAQLPVTEQLPSVPYIRGKYYYFRKQFPESIQVLRALPPTHKYYLYGLYFIAAANVAMGADHLNDAVNAFDTILKSEPQLDKDGKPVKPVDPKAHQLDDAEKIVVELAHLGRARILREEGQLTAALEEYAKISKRSSYFNDALYESAWVSIKGKDYGRAARQLDLLLLNAPDSTLAPEVRLLTGNLNIRQAQFGPATRSFTAVRDQYEPLSKTLAAEVAKEADPVAYFRDAIAKNLQQFDTAKIVPAPALKWMKDERPVQAVGSLVGDERDLDKSLADADDIIKRLERVIDGPARVNVFPELAQARVRGNSISTALTEVREVLAKRERQLIEPVMGSEGPQLKSIADERDAVEAQLKNLPTREESLAEHQAKAKAAFNELDKRSSEIQVEILGVHAQVAATQKFYHDQIEQTLPAEQQAAARQELDQWAAEMNAEQTTLDALRKEIDEAVQSVGVDDSDMRAADALKARYTELVARQHALGQSVRSRLGASERAKAEQIENVLDRVHNVETKLGQYNHRIDGLVEEKLGPIRAAIAEEKGKVGGFKTTLGGYVGESSEVGGGVLAASLRGVAQRFYNVVVRADVGIIDVAWALKDTATKETNRLISERKRELKLLDDEFKEVLQEGP